MLEPTTILIRPLLTEKSQDLQQLAVEMDVFSAGLAALLDTAPIVNTPERDVSPPHCFQSTGQAFRL